MQQMRTNTHTSPIKLYTYVYNACKITVITPSLRLQCHKSVAMCGNQLLYTQAHTYTGTLIHICTQAHWYMHFAIIKFLACCGRSKAHQQKSRLATSRRLWSACRAGPLQHWSCCWFFMSVNAFAYPYISLYKCVWLCAHCSAYFMQPFPFGLSRPEHMPLKASTFCSRYIRAATVASSDLNCNEIRNKILQNFRIK